MRRLIVIVLVVGCFYNGLVSQVFAQASSESVESILAKFNDVDSLSPEERAELLAAIERVRAEQAVLKAELESIARDVNSLQANEADTNMQLEAVSAEISDAERAGADVSVANEQMQSVMTTLESLKGQQGTSKLQMDAIETKIRNLTEMQTESSVSGAGSVDDIE